MAVRSLVSFVKGHPLLSQHLNDLQMKLSLMALVERASVAITTDRKLSFTEIAQVTSVTLEHVESLLMKGISCKIISGRINQPEGYFYIESVLPRILTSAQVLALAQAVGVWRRRVSDTLGLFAPSPE